MDSRPPTTLQLYTSTITKSMAMGLQTIFSFFTCPSAMLRSEAEAADSKRASSTSYFVSFQPWRPCPAPPSGPTFTKRGQLSLAPMHSISASNHQQLSSPGVMKTSPTICLRTLARRALRQEVGKRMRGRPLTIVLVGLVKICFPFLRSVGLQCTRCLCWHD